MGVRLSNAIVASADVIFYVPGFACRLDDNGTLFIKYDNGAMPEWNDMSDVHWDNYRSEIKSVQIEEGATSIGKYAFSYCTNLTSITIPDSVTSIGQAAFSSCTSLTSIFLPEGANVVSDAIPTSATQIKYTVDDDGNAIITKIDLGSNQTEVDIPEKIGEYPVISVAEEYQQYVGEHTHKGGTATCTENGTETAECENSCTAAFTCANDSTHVEELDCEVTVTDSTEAVCETGGSVTYTANTNKIVPRFSVFQLILIFNQPIDKSDSYNAATLRQAPLPGGSPPAVAFLDWLRSICRLCLQND